jgi:hypothetical protein
MRVKHLELEESPADRREYLRIYHREYQKMFREKISEYNKEWMRDKRGGKTPEPKLCLLCGMVTEQSPKGRWYNYCKLHRK